jgi:hypothetical protein
MEFIRINNRSNFLLKNFPPHHPESINYLTWWRAQKKRIIEGFWSLDDENYNIDISVPDVNFPESKKWRYMTPQLYFYINMGTILHNVDEYNKTSPKKKTRPHLRDVDWEFFYNWLEAKGFSGFELDDEYTCDKSVLNPELIELHKSCYKINGELKTYIPARIYLRRLFDKPIGRPLYNNEARNLFVLGARGFGKSYSVGVGIILHELLTDGAKIYNDESIMNPATVEIFVGAALSAKSSDILAKALLAYNELPGKYLPGSQDELPSPLRKEMSGTLHPNNMKNPWRNEYDKKVNGRWEKAGSKSCVKHGIWSVENPEAGVGGRYSVIVAEEIGLIPNLLTIHGANEACLYEGTNRFGSSVYIGTGGNMEKIVEAEIIFRDPEGFNFLAFDDIWENTGKIGWFVPAYYGLNQFKDSNGNTRIEEAVAYLEKRREKKRKAKSASAITLELLSYPIKPSEMFLKSSDNLFPVDDLKNRLADLEADAVLLDSSWKASFVIDEAGIVRYKNSTKPVIRDFPLKRGSYMDGSVEIFEMPKRDKDGNVFPGRYIAGTDPVDDDSNQDVTLSLQSTFILDTWTDRIVAEYTARTEIAEYYYETLRRLLMFYNAKTNYEQNKKGLYAHFKNKNSLHLLAETPKILRDEDYTKISSVGNKKFGTNANDVINEFGRRLTLKWLINQASGKDDGVMNLHGIRSVGLLKELFMWSKDMNADRVSAIGMLMIYREDIITIIERNEKRPKDVGNDPFWTNSHKFYMQGRKKALLRSNTISYNF